MTRYPRTDIDPDRIRDAIRTAGTLVEAARLLGITRVTLWKLRRRHGLQTTRQTVIQGE